MRNRWRHSSIVQVDDVIGGTDEDKKELDKCKGWKAKSLVERQELRKKNNKGGQEEKKDTWCSKKRGWRSEKGPIRRGGQGEAQPEWVFEDSVRARARASARQEELQKISEIEEAENTDALKKLRLLWIYVGDRTLTPYQLQRAAEWPLVLLREGEHFM